MKDPLADITESELAELHSGYQWSHKRLRDAARHTIKRWRERTAAAEECADRWRRDAVRMLLRRDEALVELRRMACELHEVTEALQAYTGGDPDNEGKPASELAALLDLDCNAEYERAELAESKLEHAQYWYGCRLERLSQWARESLPDSLRREHFNIVANGTATAEEPPTYAQQYNAMKHRAEKAERERNALRTELRERAEALDELAREVLRGAVVKMSLRMTVELTTEREQQLEVERDEAEQLAILLHNALVSTGYDELHVTEDDYATIERYRARHGEEP